MKRKNLYAHAKRILIEGISFGEKLPVENDNSWLGVINASCLGKLFKAGVLVGYCASTPNAIAYGMAKTGADSYVSKLVNKKSSDADMIERVKNAGWFDSDEKAHFKAI